MSLDKGCQQTGFTLYIQWGTGNHTLKVCFFTIKYV